MCKYAPCSTSTWFSRLFLYNIATLILAYTGYQCKDSNQSFQLKLSKLHNLLWNMPKLFAADQMLQYNLTKLLFVFHRVERKVLIYANYLSGRREDKYFLGNFCSFRLWLLCHFGSCNNLSCFLFFRRASVILSENCLICDELVHHILTDRKFT